MTATEWQTPLGCHVRVYPAPEHLGPGVLLELFMPQDGDLRRAEVYLDPVTAMRIGETLTDWEYIP